MKKAVVKLDNEVIGMAGAKKSKKTANKPRVLTIFEEKEIGEPGQCRYHKRQFAVHVVPLGFPPGGAEVQIARRVAAKSRVQVGTYINEEGAEECCLVLKADRAVNPPLPRETYRVNTWTEQTVKNIWEGALDPFRAIDAWQKITRILGRVRHGYIVR